jgi:formylglycine-generating enzyme required for sulfatase activity
MAAGDYTVTWNPFAGHNPPDPITETETLVGGGTINLYGTYDPLTGNLGVSPNPSGISAPWHLDGPGGYTRDGVGYIANQYLPVGDYTITWGDVPGWNTPPSETLTLLQHEITTFEGHYTWIWDPSLTLITGGKFEMGSPGTELGRGPNENQHWVQLSDFYICATEITGPEYGSLTPDYRGSSRLDWPAEWEWIEAVRFCNALSVREGLDSVYTVDGYTVTWDQSANGYRLPTEAEWEYACRAGAATAFANGAITNVACDDPVLDLIGWYCGNAPDYYVQDVGGLIANAWGMYDMHGNVAEWCWDRADSPPDPYEGTGTFENPDIDPTGPTSGSNRIQRGGTYQAPRYVHARYCRSAARYSQSLSSGNGGFRIVRNAP